MTHTTPLPCTLVTGATAGIGRELALQLAARGVKVVALGRDAQRLDELAAAAHGVYPVCVDLADSASLAPAASRVIETHPELGCLVNNAAVQYDVLFTDSRCDPALVQHEIAVNLTAPVVLTRLLLPHFMGRVGSLIVNVSSVLGHVPKKSAAVYSATKAGLHMFTRALRVQVGDSPLTVSEALLPLVDTGMTAGRGTGKISAASAARLIINGMQRRHERIRVGRARAASLLLRVAPGLLERAIQRST